jgi:hypothetical protein
MTCYVNTAVGKMEIVSYIVCGVIHMQIIVDDSIEPIPNRKTIHLLKLNMKSKRTYYVLLMFYSMTVWTGV